MIVRGKGSKIINMASRAGLVGDSERATCCSAKAGVVNRARYCRLSGSKINVTAPSSVNTPFVAALLQDDGVARPRSLSGGVSSQSRLPHGYRAYAGNRWRLDSRLKSSPQAILYLRRTHGRSGNN